MRRETEVPLQQRGRPSSGREWAGALPPALVHAFEVHGVERRLLRGARLFSAGDPVLGLHLVTSGRIRVLVGNSRPLVVHHEPPGGLLGETALFGSAPYPASAVASEASCCRLLPREHVVTALQEDGAVASYFLARLSGRLLGVIGRLDRLGRTSVATRLASHLVARHVASRGRVINLGMTQAELAEELGTVREVIVRELRRLGRSGLIEAAGQGRYRVVDVEALAVRATASRATP